MGSDPKKDRDAREDEKPQRRVFMNAFWIDKYEVTNHMYADCVSEKGCAPQTCDQVQPGLYGNYPVDCVTWEQAEKYCIWAGRQLPSEAQWEKAARGSAGYIYPWGDSAPACTLANYSGCGGASLEVDRFSSGRSGEGVYNMAGNVWEWVQDWYDPGFYAALPDVTREFSGPKTGTLKVIRGGSWSDVPVYIRAAARFSRLPASAEKNIGFRCVLQGPTP